MSIEKNELLSLGQIEGQLRQLLLMVVSRQSEIRSLLETTHEPETIAESWLFTVVGKDCDDQDTGSAVLVYDDRLITTIKRLMDCDDETTHVEIHEGDVR